MDELTRLAQKFGTDKWGVHFYTHHYHRHFEHLRNKPMRLLEIGVGGYENPDLGGESLRMWKAYFPHAEIIGLDCYDKVHLQEDRIRIIRGSQEDQRFLAEWSTEHGPFDIVIDDGSHLPQHVITSFETLFPILTEDGIYVIEDIQTSYWPVIGGTTDLKDPTSVTGRLKSLVDKMNYAEILMADTTYETDVFSNSIVALHFYHNMAFIQKGRNTERSNLAFALDDPHVLNALTEINQTLSEEGASAGLLFTQARILEQLRRYGEAIEVQCSVVALEPTARQFSHLANSYKLAGRWTEAITAFSNAASLSQSSEFYATAISECKEKLQLSTQAVEAPVLVVEPGSGRPETGDA